MPRLPSQSTLLELICCPETHQALSVVDPSSLDLKNKDVTYKEVLLRPDGAIAYPIRDGLPVLLRPEEIGITRSIQYDKTVERYREAYEEMEHYNKVADQQISDLSNDIWFRRLSHLQESNLNLDHFPSPHNKWLDAFHDLASQKDAYENIGPVVGKTILQIGGKGIHALKLIIAGADRAVLLTPMIAEARWAVKMAELLGIEDRLYPVIGIAEEAPFKNGSFDAIYSGGSLHHTITDLSLFECARILKKGGKFSAVDPWKSPLHKFGTKVFGKRDPHVNCIPLDVKRMARFGDAFPSGRIALHGAIFRYPVIILHRFGLHLSLNNISKVDALDDAISNKLPLLRKLSSSVAVLGQREHQ